MLIEIRSLSAAECRIRTFMSIPLFPSGYKYFVGKSAGGWTKEPDGAGGGRGGGVCIRFSLRRSDIKRRVFAVLLYFLAAVFF